MSPYIWLVLACLVGGMLWAAVMVVLADRSHAERSSWALLGFLLGPLAVLAVLFRSRADRAPAAGSRGKIRKHRARHEWVLALAFTLLAVAGFRMLLSLP